MAFDYSTVKTETFSPPREGRRLYLGYNLSGSTGMLLNVRLQYAVPGNLPPPAPPDVKGTETELYLPGDTVSGMAALSWTTLKTENLGNGVTRVERAYATPGGNVLVHAYTEVTMVVERTTRTMLVDDKFHIIEQATLSGTDILKTSAFRAAQDFRDDLDNSSIHPTWELDPHSGTIVETDKLTISLAPGIGGDWTVPSQTSPNVHFQLAHPGNFFAYVHCTIPANDNQGGAIVMHYGPAKQYYNELQLTKSAGTYKLLAIRQGVLAPTGAPPNSNPLVIGQNHCWLGIIRMGDWFDFCYNLNTVNNEPDVNAWREQAASIGTNFDHFDNDVALAGFNYGTLPGCDAEFRKFRLLYM